MHPGVPCSTVCDGQDMEATSMSINRGMDKEGVIDVRVYAYKHVYVMEYYSAMKRKEIMPFAEMWLE